MHLPSLVSHASSACFDIHDVLRSSALNFCRPTFRIIVIEGVGHVVDVTDLPRHPIESTETPRFEKTTLVATLRPVRGTFRTRIGMSISRTKPLGDELLAALKQGPTQDCYVLKCVDSEERMIHRTVLTLSSTYFANRIRDNPTQSSEDVPFTSEVIDAIIRYLYSSNPTVVPGKHAIKLYIAANMFNLEDLSRQLRVCFQSNWEGFLEDENFLVNVSLDEMKLMEKVFNFGALGTTGQMFLVTHILRWGEAKEVGSEYIVSLLSALTKYVRIARQPPKRRAY